MAIEGWGKFRGDWRGAAMRCDRSTHMFFAAIAFIATLSSAQAMDPEREGAACFGTGAARYPQSTGFGTGPTDESRSEV